MARKSFSDHIYPRKKDFCPAWNDLQDDNSQGIRTYRNCTIRKYTHINPHKAGDGLYSPAPLTPLARSISELLEKFTYPEAIGKSLK